MRTISYIETVRIRGLRYPLTVVRSGPHSGSPIRKENRINLDCCIFFHLKKTEDTGMRIISFL